MKYVSTRGEAPILDFDDVLLAGLARDGGLYVPENLPTLTDADFTALTGAPYRQFARRIMSTFRGDAGGDRDQFLAAIDGAYDSFVHPAIAPLKQIGPNDWVMELFQGPTLAFKDFALQVLGRLFDLVLQSRGQRITVLGATSGDTGSAAIEGCRGRDAIDIFIMFPNGRVSDVQRRQMTTVEDANVHAIAIDGDFDDCQALVKAAFNDLSFRDEMALSAINSINWARVAAQVPYYLHAALLLGGPARPVAFSVPTGNFGDIFAGYVAASMGLPIDRLVVATNVNDILTRFLQSGEYRTLGVTPTMSPSMDIQVSSNFERLLFDLLGRDGAPVRSAMDRLVQGGGFTVPDSALDAARKQFSGHRVGEDQCLDVMRRVYAETAEVIDPHTAIGVGAAWAARAQGEIDPETPMVTLSTAHPAKFPDAVEKAIGKRPDLPERVADLFERKERMDVLPNDLAAVQKFMRERARIAG